MVKQHGVVERVLDMKAMFAIVLDVIEAILEELWNGKSEELLDQEPRLALLAKAPPE